MEPIPFGQGFLQLSVPDLNQKYWKFQSIGKTDILSFPVLRFGVKEIGQPYESVRASIGFLVATVLSDCRCGGLSISAHEFCGRG